MKNKKIFIILAAVMIVSLSAFYSFSGSFKSEKNVSSAIYSLTDTTDAKTYICPMHPDIISDKPGKCPKCGMDLELKEDSTKKDEGMNGDMKDGLNHSMNHTMKGWMKDRNNECMKDGNNECMKDGNNECMKDGMKTGMKNDKKDCTMEHKKCSGCMNK